MSNSKEILKKFIPTKPQNFRKPNLNPPEKKPNNEKSIYTSKSLNLDSKNNNPNKENKSNSTIINLFKPTPKAKPKDKIFKYNSTKSKI